MKNLQYGSRPLLNYDDIFIISDVQGDLVSLKKLIVNLPLNEKSVLVFVGDLFDAGPNGVGVLRFIKELKMQYQVYVVEGNHENIFKKIVSRTYAIQGALDNNFLNEFLYHGANSITPQEIEKVLIKYDIKSVLDETIPYFETPDLIVTHAPIDRVVWGNMNFDEWQDTESIQRGYPLDYLYSCGSLLWTFTRNESEEIEGMTKFLVCGHQNHRCQYDQPRIFKNRAYLDCGAGYCPGKSIFAMQFPSKTIYSS